MDSVDVMIDTLSGFSEKIAQAIGCEDWDGLNDVLMHRQECLKELFSAPIKPTQRSAVIDLMLKIQQEDRLYMAGVKDRKQALQKHASLLTQGRKSVKVYQSEQDESKSD
ncbi:flagellar protein FliT [Methylotuvimicrobium sp. KM1]|uniref:flagellar protein FliT n=1 Tax=Methylotuvimicrobium sp. KM1 TaxID=3377707 RepID=UPI0038515F94